MRDQAGRIETVVTGVVRRFPMRSRSPGTTRGMLCSHPLAIHGAPRSCAGSRHQWTPSGLMESTYVEPEAVLASTTEFMATTHP